ncbi:hypothetical protein HGM15179_014916 [Zosterops borbonicus]|uniref:Uncharacterized protein n=1 Tax=Zosterops borbonicus TaxID=364589 RepID=A0A8K1G5W3_9PASS|nr:hypothetical protein HGM15179_014916 [Zosterops borbonicus]
MGKCQIPIMGWVNSRCMDRVGNEMLESSAMERDLGVLVSGKLNTSQQCPGSQEGQECPGGIRPSMASRAREGIVPLSLSWGSLTSVLGAEEGLRELGLFSLQERRFRGNLIPLYNLLKGGCSQV